MKLTPKRINAIITRYHELLNLADRFVDSYNDGNTRSARHVRIASDGSIWYEKNTACHCHPEYEDFTISAREFNEWLEKQTD